MSRFLLSFVVVACLLASVAAAHAVEALRAGTEQFFPMARDGSIAIENTDGEIHIFGWREPRVRLATLRRAYSPARLQQIKIETHATARGLDVRTIIPPARGFFADRSGTVEYTVNVPEAAQLHLQLRNGEISVASLRGGSAEIDLGNGRVTAFNCGGRVRARAKTGALEVFYQWWENLPATFDYAIDYGTIRAFFPPGAQFHVDALTTDGSIDDEFLRKQGHDVGRGQALIAETGPNAPVTLHFRDNGGNISIDTSRGVDLPPTLAARPRRQLQIAPVPAQSRMPSFDIVSELDKQEIDNALNQARKELATRFDFKGAAAEILLEKDKIVLTAVDASHLRGLREIVVGKLAKRGVDLRNIDQEEPAISSMGHARQEMKIQQGLGGDKAKEIIAAIKGAGFKVQNQLQDQQIRVTGKKRDELQEVIAFIRRQDFGVATSFKNFRE